jgi:hypothetical protein
MQPIFSIIASAHRPKDWMAFYNSIKTNLSFEIIFVGENPPDFELPPNFKYIYAIVKPTQCAEIALREATGELIHWTADDAEYGPYALDKIYELYQNENNYKCMIGFTLMEQHFDGTFYDRTQIHYCAGKKVIPFGCISRKLVNEIGGFDINFIAGQCENDLVLRGYAIGGYVKICPEAILYNCETKHWDGKTGEHRFEPSRAYEQQLLKELWLIDGQPTLNRTRPFERFKEIDLQTVNQGPSGIWKD